MESFKGKETHRELGRGMGETFRNTIAAIVSELEVEKRLNPDTLARLHSMEHRVSSFLPHLLEEIAGIADGAALDYSLVLAYNFLTSVQWSCTNVAFQDSPEGVILGKTNDIGENKANYHVLLDLTLPTGMRLLHFSWPGTVWSNAGVNSEGIAQAGASVRSETVDRCGLESNLLQRVILERSRTLTEAINHAAAFPIKNHPANLTLADDRNVVVVEKGVGDWSVRLPENGIIFATNHWVTDRMAPACDLSTQSFRDNTFARWRNLERLASQYVENQSLTSMKDVLCDHSQPGAICQHGPTMHTTVSYIVLPRHRRIHFTYGRPCEAESFIFDMG